MDDPEHATKILSQNLVRYMGSLDTPEAKDRIEVAKKNYSAIEITPLFMATRRA